ASWVQLHPGAGPTGCLRLFLGASLLALLLAGCAPGVIVVTATPESASQLTSVAASPTNAPSRIASPTEVAPGPTATPDPATPNPTDTPTPPSPTPVPPTPTSAPKVYVRVGNPDCDGVFLRRSTNLDDRLAAWPDGTRLEVLGVPTTAGGLSWLKVRAPDGAE